MCGAGMGRLLLSVTPASAGLPGGTKDPSQGSPECSSRRPVSHLPFKPPQTSAGAPMAPSSAVGKRTEPKELLVCGRRGCGAGGPPHEGKDGGRAEMLVHYAREQIMPPAWVLVSVGAEPWQLLKVAPKET